MYKFNKLSLCVIISIVLFCDTSFAEEKKKVGVMWIGKSGMAKRVITGFDQGIKDKLDKLDVEYIFEIKSKDVALPIYQRYQKEKDAVIFLRSNGLKFMIEHPPEKPTFCGGCTNPKALGAIKNLDNPEGNLTGVTYFLPATKQMDVFKNIFPKLKSVGLLNEKGHPSSSIDQMGTENACKTYGIELHIVEAVDKKEIVLGMSNLVDKVDIFIIGNQAMIIDNAKTIGVVAKNIPVCSYAEKPIKKNQALCGLTPDDVKLGRMLAESLISVLLEGKKISDVPVKTDTNPLFMVSIPIMNKMRLKIPDNIMQDAKKIN